MKIFSFFGNYIATAAGLTLTALLGGCASTPPDTIVKVPLTARAQAPSVTAQSNGAIFQAASYRPMFEDRRARLVGDILVINIVEKTSAGKAAASSGSKSGGASMGIPTVAGLPLKSLQGTSLEATSALKYDDKGAQTASNTFSGTIGVTVIEVLPNGNLLVSGEKQVALDKGSEFIRFSGVINPDTISTGNIVSSTQVADAKVEYRTNSSVDKAQAMSMLARFFYSLLPI